MITLGRAVALATIILPFSLAIKAQDVHILQQTSFGCRHEQTFEKIMNYARGGDVKGFRENLSIEVTAGECIEFHPGDAVSLVDMSRHSGMYKIRRRGNNGEYWTLPTLFSPKP